MNQIPPLVFTDDESSCNKFECIADVTETCGSKDRVRIYRTPLAGLLMF